MSSQPSPRPSAPDTGRCSRRESTTVYVVQYQPDEDRDQWLDKADGQHPTLAAARQYRSGDDITPLRIVRRTDTVVETLPDPRASDT